MVQYILECIAFQLVFLLIYDLFLKKETFFQWNRVYLLGTYVLSLLLPWIKIEALKTRAPEVFQGYPEFMWNANDAAIIVANSQQTGFSISWEYMVLFGGMLLATVFFGYKLFQLYALKQKGEVQYFKDFTQVVIKNSSMAFSFFKSIFLGDQVLEKEHQNILEHELVHIREKHSYDLFFFEIMRIVGWFNPLVYVYQSRIAELHEFIADAKVAKTSKNEQYEFLLSQVFQTQNISFINQFFNSSLIKKRIVMLQKTKSKKIFKLKYLALLPMVVVMLIYSSCEMEHTETVTKDTEMVVEDISNMSEIEDQKLFATLKAYSDSGEYWEFVLKDDDSSIKYTSSAEKSYIKFDGRDEKIWATMVIEGPDSVSLLGSDSLGIAIAFAVVDEVPIFPGCENVGNPRECFQKSIQKHISKNFRYPEEAQEKGIQGRVSVMFTISTDGLIQNVKMRGPDKLLEEEVARIISKLPTMTPGKQDGKVVNVPFSIPITFKLQGPSTLHAKTNGNAIQVNEKGFKIKGENGLEPIYIIDGEKSTSEKLAAINPDDIATINVYKDEIATKLYGSEAINGAVVINLKNDKIQIKNIESKNGLDPIYIVDGKVTTKEKFEKIKPEDVKSMNVLKDESAIKKHGSTATNGVIEIEMKNKD
ncbi:TonB family protein [Aurantibacter crassamenti]|uniref:TonB family protein n=1 Tax=Aurantibacter crassamenti TaxID=1837375 RepID=UPI00193A0AE6|nr:TonB family protein [Aurantibacter crassamenti]MBM1105650.1 TonB family protein [Aurantibacter crassamenti]